MTSIETPNSNLNMSNNNLATSISGSGSNAKNIFGSSVSKDDNEEIKKMMVYKKEDFREDIRKSKTNTALHQKRIRVFKQNVIQKCEEQCEESMQAFYIAEKESDIEKMQIAIGQMKELSQESRSQKYLLDTDLVKYLCVLLNPTFRQYSQLQIDVCWILSNLSCDQHFNITKYENLSSQVITNLLLFLQEDKIESINAAFWCLSNLAGDVNYTTTIYEENIIAKITDLLDKKKFNEDIICQISYIYLNLTEQIKTIDEKSVHLILQTINEFSELKNDEIIYNLIKIINNIAKCKENATAIRSQFNSKLMNLIFIILATHNNYYLESILEFVGNLIHLNDTFSRVLLERGFKETLIICLETKDRSIRKKAGWVLSNILSNSQQDIEDIFNEERLINKVLTLITIDTLEVKGVLLQGLFNAFELATKKQFKQILDKQFITVLYNILKDEDNEYIVLLCLDILRLFLCYDRESQNDGEIQESIVFNQLLSTGLIDLIQNLQSHSSDYVYNKTINLINEFFDSEETNNNDPDI